MTHQAAQNQIDHSASVDERLIAPSQKVRTDIPERYFNAENRPVVPNSSSTRHSDEYASAIIGPRRERRQLLPFQLALVLLQLPGTVTLLDLAHEGF